jgi:hypothetical protein
MRNFKKYFFSFFWIILCWKTLMDTYGIETYGIEGKDTHYESLGEYQHFKKGLMLTPPQHIQTQLNTRLALTLSHSCTKKLKASILNENPLCNAPYPKILSQSYNDCVVNAVASTIEYLTIPRDSSFEKSPLLPLIPSRSALYSLSKQMAYSTIEAYKKSDHTAWQQDVGIDFGSVLLTVDKFGVLPETAIAIPNGTRPYMMEGWEYHIINILPSASMMLFANDENIDGINQSNENDLLEHQIISAKDLCATKNYYARVRQTIRYKPLQPSFDNEKKLFNDLCDAFRSNKPVLIGIGVNQSFMQSAKTKGLVQKGGTPASDFHAILALGFKDFCEHKNCVYVQNSWGPGWGDGGRGYLTWDYFKHHFYGGYVVWLDGFF